MSPLQGLETGRREFGGYRNPKMHLSWEIPYRPIPDLTSRELAHRKYFQNFAKKVSTFEGVKHLYREGFLISEIFIPPPLKAGNEKAPPCGGAFSLFFFFRRAALQKTIHTAPRTLSRRRRRIPSAYQPRSMASSSASACPLLRSGDRLPLCAVR